MTDKIICLKIVLCRMTVLQNEIRTYYIHHAVICTIASLSQLLSHGLIKCPADVHFRISMEVIISGYFPCIVL